MKTASQIKYSRIQLVIIIFIDMMAFTVILPVMPDLMHYYSTRFGFLTSIGSFMNVADSVRASREVILGGFMISLWAFVQFFSMPLWGRISDRTGRKRILIFTASGQIAANLIWTFAVSLPVFLVYRIIGGMMSGNISVAYAAMADLTSKKERTKYMGLLGAAGGIGMIAGPVVGGSLTHPAIIKLLAHNAYLHPFSACAMLSAVLFTLNTILMLWFKETLPGHGDISSNENIPPDLPLIHISFKPDFHLPGFVRLAILNFFFCFSLAGIELILPYFLKLRLGSSAAVIGLFFLLIGITMAFGQSTLIPFLVKKISEKKVALLGFALIPLPLLATGFLVHTYAWTIVNILPIVIGISVIGPSLSGMVSRLAPSSKQGYILGLFNSYGSLAYTVGPVMTSFFYGAGGVYVACSFISFMSITAFIILSRLKETGIKE